MPKVQKRTLDGDRLQTYPKGEYEPMTVGDPSSALINMGISSLSGRNPAYTDDDEGLQLFQDRTVAYFRHLKQVNEDRETEQVLLPDIESWATFLQVTRATIWNYRKTRNDDWRMFIDRVKTLILAMRKDAATRFKCPPMVYVFDAVNNFDYRNTNEVHITTEEEEPRTRIDSPEEIARRHAGATLPQLPDLITEEEV